MSQKKQTARKTTGKHLLLSSSLSPGPPPTPARRQLKKRVQHRSPAKSPPLKSILKCPSAAAAPSPGHSAPAFLVPIPSTPCFESGYVDIDIPDDPEPVSLLSDAPPSPNGTVTDHAPGPELGPGAGPLVAWHRPALHVLDKPISVCMRFATWLESDKCVHEDALVRAVERDGRLFLSLAKATVMFDDALRGRAPLTHTPNGGATGPFGEYARTLRVFAELLKNKISEGNLSEELEAAVLRDGEPLLRLAVCCLELDQAMRGSDGTAGS